MAENVLVIGGNGLVGNALVRAWARRGVPVIGATYHCHPGGPLRQLDMRDRAAVDRLIDELRPNLVAVPAAQPHVDYIEQHPEETRRLNVEGTRNVALSCRERGLPMIFYSSDYVFDGKKDVYVEDDATCPLNEYGRQKVETERIVLESDARNLVLRISGAYGWQREPKNFVLQLRARLPRGERVKVADDVRYNPTSADNIADLTVALARRGASGIYHLVGSDRLIRYRFALKIADVFGLDKTLLEPVAMASLNVPTPRPRESSLDTGKVRRFLGIVPWGVDQGLRAMKDSEPEWLAQAASR